MTWKTLKLKEITFIDTNKKPASIKFNLGANVICGASDTGKSFIVESIDFLLGASSPLRDIPERKGYNRGCLTIETSEMECFKIERSVNGGDFELSECSTNKKESLKWDHEQGQINNLSGWLLSKIGLFNKIILKNKKGETQSLSFRNLSKLIIVKEEDIIKVGSPFLTGQFILKSAESRILKLLLTGTDDSEIVSASDLKKTQKSAPAKIEFINEWINKFKAELGSINRKEIDKQLECIEKNIESQKVTLEKIRQQIEPLIVDRRKISIKREKINDRIEEINGNLSRFELLKKHYSVDLERLASIEETGSLFVFQEKAPCPLCGALPDAQHLEENCDGNINVVIRAAQAEITKINNLSSELVLTITDLQSESNNLNIQLLEVKKKYQKIDDKIRERNSQDLIEAQKTFSNLVEKCNELKRLIDKCKQLDWLQKQKEELEVFKSGKNSGSLNNELPNANLNEFSQKVKEILKIWDFPGVDTVHFDSKKMDFVINGKARGSRGKGLRAITHAAASIALMEYCQENDLPHAGFVVLDSPLLAYYEPEGEGDDLRGTDLKNKFYGYLASMYNRGQVIVIENEQPPDEYNDTIFTKNFTKNPHQGRYGFFPTK